MSDTSQRATALRHLSVHPDASIRAAMEAISRGAVKLALVVDDGGQLVGTVSNGDARRALLAGRSLGDGVAPHVNRAPSVVSESMSRAEVLDIMRARALSAIPIVTEKGQLRGLHLISELLGLSARSNVAVIMAGGLGRRLAPMTDAIPKPMLSVAGRPILERLVLHLVGSGIQRIFISVNYLRHMIEDHFGDGSAFGCQIEYLRESPDCPLGTAGSLRLITDHVALTEPLIVMNGDLVTEFSVGGLLQAHATSDAVATVSVNEYIHTVPFSVAEVDGDRVHALTEHPTMAWLINAGIYVLEPHLIARVPPERLYHVPDLLAECLERGERVETWQDSHEWLDVGRPEEFRRANGRP